MKILYATDGSAGACAAGDFLKRLSLPREAHIHIVSAGSGRDRDAVLPAAQAHVGELGVSVTSEFLAARTTAAAINAVLTAADDLAADFILIGAFGHSALTRLFVGSVAGGVARASRRSVLMVRPGIGKALESVVVGIDSSAGCHEAVRWTADAFPLPSACTLRLVAVVPSQTWAKFVIPSPENPYDAAQVREVIRVQTVEEEKARARSCVEALARELNGVPGDTACRVEATGQVRSALRLRSVCAEVRQGMPVDELVRAADDTASSLIVVGAHDQKPIERILLGSVSEGVLHHAHGSVLIVRTPPCGG